ncbi:MAG: cell division protein FtsA [Opitutales bacterium]|nr:cell division protein FtsA [Opitutales bacterium]
MQAALYAIVDVGTAFTKVLIVEVNPDLKILSSAKRPTQGMIRGEILNMQALNECVHGAINEAENKAQLAAGNVHRAVMSISGYRQVAGRPISGVTSTKAKCVSAEDMRTAKADAYAHLPQEGYCIVHRVGQCYSITPNGKAAEFTKTPQGKVSSELKYYLWMVEGKKDYLTEMVQIANAYDLHVSELFAASLASARATETGDGSKNRLVVDIGAGTTDFAYYDEEGILRGTGVIPVGGMNINRDITVGMHAENENAEKLKTSYSSAILSSEDAKKDCGLPSGERYSRYILNTIVSERVGELFDLVRRALPPEAKVSSLVLTGGTAKLDDIAVAAGNVFKGATVTVSEPKLEFAENLDDPSFSTVVGLASLFEKQYKERLKRTDRKSVWQQLKELFI